VTPICGSIAKYYGMDTINRLYDLKQLRQQVGNRSDSTVLYKVYFTSKAAQILNIKKLQVMYKSTQ